MAEAGAGGRTLTREGEENGSVEAVGEMGLLSAEGNIKPRLLEYQKDFVRHIASGFDGRIRDKPVARLLRAIVDFRRMPLDFYAASQQQLLVWGNDKVVELCGNNFTGLSPSTLQNQTLSARIFVCENKTRPMHPKDPKGRK